MFFKILKIQKMSALTVFMVSIYVSTVNAEFLDMPEIEQLRDLEQKTLLRDLDIPGVRDRSPDPTAGPRLAVSEFRIQGLIEFPELGITRDALAELVEGIRFQLMAEGKLLESGYTIDELGELSDLLVDIEEETVERHVTPLEVQKLVWLIRDQRGKRGVTLGQIESVANRITNFYRERGFILAKAYIPKQQVRDGVVNLTLLLGVLGEVSVNGNDLYSAETLREVFSDLMSKPITNKVVEENLYIINGYPGVTVDGYFEPGYQVGDTRLNINVKSETRFNTNVRVDSHGTDESGLYRLYADFQINNLIGLADLLHVSILQTVVPENTTYGQLDFKTNLFSPRFKVGFDISRNQFVVDQSAIGVGTDLSGIVDVRGFFAEYISQRGRKRNSTYEIRYETISSDLALGAFNNDTADEELTQYSIKYRLDVLDDEKKRLHEGNIKFTYGTFDFGADAGQDLTYQILSGEYTLLTFLKIPFTDSNSRLIFRTGLQYSGSNLSSIARFSLAGPTRARAFSPSLFTADDAVYVAADWIFNSPDLLDFEIASVNIMNLVKPFVFIDYARGTQYSLLVDMDGSPGRNTHGDIADIGFGLQFSRGFNFSGNLVFGFPILEKLRASPDAAGAVASLPDSDSVRLLFDFQYTF